MLGTPHAERAVPLFKGVFDFYSSPRQEVPVLRMYQNPRGWPPPGWVNDQATTAYLAAQLDALNQQIQPQNTAATRKQNVEQLCKAKAEAIFKKYGWSDVMTIAEIIEFLAWAVGSGLLVWIPGEAGWVATFGVAGPLIAPQVFLAPLIAGFGICGFGYKASMKFQNIYLSR